eukprot:7169725-Pyramimonas_sp.AAC.1
MKKRSRALRVKKNFCCCECCCGPLCKRWSEYAPSSKARFQQRVESCRPASGVLDQACSTGAPPF